MKEYRITEKQLETLRTIIEKLKIGDLKAAIKSADAMSTYLEMHAETPEEKGLYESYLETWDNSHMQLEDIAENAREMKYLVEDIEGQKVETGKRPVTLLEAVGASAVISELCPGWSQLKNTFEVAGYKQPDSACPSGADGNHLSCSDCWNRLAEPLEDSDHAR